MEDTAWHPVQQEVMDKWNPMAKHLYQIFLGSPLKLWASIGHWLMYHFDLKLYNDKQRPRVSCA